MSEENSCGNCGVPTENEPLVLCDACNEVEGKAADADLYCQRDELAEALRDLLAQRPGTMAHYEATEKARAALAKVKP